MDDMHDTSTLVSINDESDDQFVNPLSEGQIVVRVAIDSGGYFDRILYVGHDIDIANSFLLREIQASVRDLRSLLVDEDMEKLNNALEDVEKGVEVGWSADVGDFTWIVESVDSSWYYDAWRDTTTKSSMKTHPEVVVARSEDSGYTWETPSGQGASRTMRQAKLTALRSLAFSSLNFKKAGDNYVSEESRIAVHRDSLGKWTVSSLNEDGTLGKRRTDISYDYLKQAKEVAARLVA